MNLKELISRRYCKNIHQPF